MGETIVPDTNGFYRLTSDIDPAIVEALRRVGHIDKLSITRIPVVTVKHASRLKPLHSVDSLWLWCEVTRRAMRHFVQIPGLRTFDLLALCGPGELGCFDSAKSLEVFRANCGLTEQDLLQIAKCESLTQLGIQSANLTQKALRAILSLPQLQSVDAEATPIDDRMARAISRVETITSLDLGGTRITRFGLKHLVTMENLKSLDIWATHLSEADLELLTELPNLECLTLGNYDHRPQLDPQRVVPLILKLPKLKKVWLDGIVLSENDQRALREKLEVRITS